MGSINGLKCRIIIAAIAGVFIAACTPAPIHYGIGIPEVKEGGTTTTTTYCVHKVTSVSKVNGECNKYKKDDPVCINCAGGLCPLTTKFVTDDGTWLRACEVTTESTDTSCKEIWPRGTCNYYVTISKD